MCEYTEKLEEFYNNFGNAKKMVLATSKDNRVTARTMSVILVNNIFYFQSDKTFLKYEQMIANPLVALCVDNIQIEGIATVIGSPISNENIFFANAFRENYKSSFDSYSSLKNEVLIEIKPTKITIWEYENRKPYRIFFDISEQIFLKKAYIID